MTSFKDLNHTPYPQKGPLDLLGPPRYVTSKAALPSTHPGLELFTDNQGSSCLDGKALLEGVTLSVGG